MRVERKVDDLIGACWQTLDRMQEEQRETMIALGQTRTQRDALGQQLTTILYRSGLIAYSARRLHRLMDANTFSLVVMGYIHHHPRATILSKVTAILSKGTRHGPSAKPKQATHPQEGSTPDPDQVPSVLPTDRARTGRTAHSRVGPRRDPRRTDRCEPYAVSEP